MTDKPVITPPSKPVTADVKQEKPLESKRRPLRAKPIEFRSMAIDAEADELKKPDNKA